jgi:hypothetical protein
MASHSNGPWALQDITITSFKTHGEYFISGETLYNENPQHKLTS